MRIPERDVTYIVLPVYLHLPVPLGIKCIIPKLIQLKKTFKLELDFAEYIQYTDVRIVDLYWASYISSTR